MKPDQILYDIQLGFKTLMLHKLRSLLTMLGVVFGVSSVIAMLAVGEGANKEALNQIKMLGSHNIIVSSQKPTVKQSETEDVRWLSKYGLYYYDDDRIKESFLNVKRTIPVKSKKVKALSGRLSTEVRVVGTKPEWFELFQRPLLAGRYIVEDDLRRKTTACVLTEKVARKVLAKKNSIGESIIIDGQSFEVVGIINVADNTGGGMSADQSDDVYISIETYKTRFGDISFTRESGSFESNKIELDQIIVEVKGTAFVESVANGINTMLKRFHPKGDYKVDVPLQLLKQEEATNRTFNIVLGSIAGISLLVGGIGIMNIMLASVTERTKEIGLRRAIGAKRGQIITQFLIETIALSSAGGVIGIVLGVAVPYFIEYFSGMPTVIPLYSVVLSLIISVGVGIIFGLYPARKAANLDPIVALRRE